MLTPQQGTNTTTPNTSKASTTPRTILLALERAIDRLDKLKKDPYTAGTKTKKLEDSIVSKIQEQIKANYYTKTYELLHKHRDAFTPENYGSLVQTLSTDWRDYLTKQNNPRALSIANRSIDKLQHRIYSTSVREPSGVQKQRQGTNTTPNTSNTSVTPRTSLIALERAIDQLDRLKEDPYTTDTRIKKQEDSIVSKIQENIKADSYIKTYELLNKHRDSFTPENYGSLVQTLSTDWRAYLTKQNNPEALLIANRHIKKLEHRIDSTSVKKPSGVQEQLLQDLDKYGLRRSIPTIRPYQLQLDSLSSSNLENVFQEYFNNKNISRDVDALQLPTRQNASICLMRANGQPLEISKQENGDYLLSYGQIRNSLSYEQANAILAAAKEVWVPFTPLPGVSDQKHNLSQNMRKWTSEDEGKFHTWVKEHIATDSDLKATMEKYPFIWNPRHFPEIYKNQQCVETALLPLIVYSYENGLDLTLPCGKNKCRSLKLSNFSTVEDYMKELYPHLASAQLFNGANGLFSRVSSRNLQPGDIVSMDGHAEMLIRPGEKTHIVFRGGQIFEDLFDPQNRNESLHDLYSSYPESVINVSNIPRHRRASWDKSVGYSEHGGFGMSPYLDDRDTHGEEPIKYFRLNAMRMNSAIDRETKAELQKPETTQDPHNDPLSRLNLILPAYIP